MVQAAAIRGIDYAEANPRNRYWWLKVRWIVDRLEDLNTEKVFMMQHAQHAAVLDYKLEGIFDKHWDDANRVMTGVYELNFPWDRNANDKARKSAQEKLMEQWRAKYGDPNDPKVQAHFKKVADAWRKHSASSSEGFEEQKSLRHMVNTIVKGRQKGKK